MRRLLLLLALLVVAGCAPATPTLLRIERVGETTSVLTIDVEGHVRRDDQPLADLGQTALLELTLLTEAVGTLPDPVGSDPDDGVLRRLTIGEETLEVRGLPTAPEPYRTLLVRLDALFARP